MLRSSLTANDDQTRMVDCVSLETGSAGCPYTLGGGKILAKGGSASASASVFSIVSVFVFLSLFVSGVGGCPYFSIGKC